MSCTANICICHGFCNLVPAVLCSSPWVKCSLPALRKNFFVLLVSPFPVLPIFGTKLKFSEPKLPARNSSFCKLIQFCSILRHSFCLSSVSLSRKRHNILGFAYYPSSRVLRVILANPQTFGFEFHLRSLPCAFSKRSVNQLVVLHLATTPP